MGDPAENFEEVSLKIDQVREKFNQTYADQISTNAYAECDLERLQTEDEYVQCFLRHQHGNMDKAVAMIDTSLRWRNDMGLHELTEKSFPREMHEMGAIHFHSQDRKARKILYFQVSKTKKDPEKIPMVKKFVAWWIDKHFLKNTGEKIVVLFDMTDAGLGNMDMELIKYQIQCFTTFYPALLDYMIIYEMPFILNAIWKIIKNILSAEQQKAVLFMKRSEIQMYIAPENLWTHMGGTDTFQYSYIPSEDSGIDIPEGDTPSDTDTSSVSSKKKVSFKEQEEPSILSNEVSIKKQESGSRHEMLFPKDVFHAEFASISPGEDLVFIATDDQKEISATLSITNTIQEPIAYKVKTTSPDGYRVRPSSGIIHPNTTCNVQVFLQQSHRDHMSRDKFLIMLMKIGEKIPPQSKLASMWKGPKILSNYTEHRLICVLRMAEEQFYERQRGGISEPLQKLSLMMGNIMDQQNKLEQRLTRMFTYQILIGALMIFAIIVMVAGVCFTGQRNPYMSASCSPFSSQH